MIKILSDISNYIKLIKGKYKTGFFCENNNIFEYLEPYIEKKSKKQKIILITFEKIEKKIENVEQCIFYLNFFRELVFLTLKLKYLYSSTPGLNQSLFKKSKFSKCKYIFLQHSLCSMIMIYSKFAFDSFDAIQAVTNYQFNELLEIKNKRNLNYKIFKSNYLFLKKKNSTSKTKFEKTVLIAPTWNTSFFKLGCHEIICSFLKKNKISYDLRPHPMSFKKKEISIEELKKKEISININTNLNFMDYKILVSDWSGIFLEFAVLNKTVFLIDTPKKILNEEFRLYENYPAEIRLRENLAKSFSIENLENLVEEIKKENAEPRKNNLNKIDKFYFEI